MTSARFTPFPVLLTERLMLRSLSADDEQAIFRLRSDESVLKYIERPGAISVADARRFIKTIRAGIERDECLYWAVVLKDTHTLIGTVCLWNFSPENRKAETGYELMPAFQGKGYMQEAFESVLTFAFDQLNLAVIEAFTSPENHRSIRLLKRNGFRRLTDAEAGGYFDPGSAPAAVFQLSREQAGSMLEE